MDFIKQFQDPPKDYSMLAFWFWNGELKEDRLRWQIGEMVDKGVYGGFMHSRAYLKTPYLEQEWWDAVGACVDEGKKKGFHPWLYDEYAWPSGTAGSTFEYGFQKPSRTLAEGEQNMAKGLYAKVFALDKAEGTGLEKRGDAPQDRLLKTYERDGRILAFYRKVFPSAVDYLNKETIARFIEYTHEEYRKRFGEEFGKLIPGIFFDEIYMMGNPIPWTDRLPEVFEQRHGYDIFDILSSLVEGSAPEDEKARLDYFDVVASMYEDAFFVQISEWCEANHLMLTGHTEEFLWEHPRRQGDYFKTMRHLAVPGSDNHDYRYRFPRKITYCEPKYSVSTARAYGKERCMSEAMGGAGWGCSLEEYKRGINTMGAMGTSMFIPHGFYYECEHQGSQSDWPASFFYQNPYWKYFKVFADYVRRISYMNSVGRPVVEYGIFYPVDEMRRNMVDGKQNAYGMAVSRKFHEALNVMIENQMDTDMIDRESLLLADMRDGVCEVGQQRFRTLLFAKGVRLDRGLTDALNRFRQSGGNVVFYETGFGVLPPGMEDCPVCEVRQLVQEMERQGTPDVKVVFGSRRDLFVNHRSCEDGEYYFISNSSPTPRELIVQVRTAGPVCFLNPETGKAQPVVSRGCPAGTEAELYLNEDEAGYLFFGKAAEGEGTMEEEKTMEAESAAGAKAAGKADPKWDMRTGRGADAADRIPVMGAWKFLPLPSEYDSRWDINAAETELEIPIATFASSLDQEPQTIRICNTNGQPGCCGRHISRWKGNWITRRASWNDQLNAGDLYFRKILELDSDVRTAEICVAAVHSLEIFINGRLAAQGDSRTEPLVFHVEDYLKKGRNVIAVHVHNETPLHDVYVCSSEELPPDRFISLLLQGEIGTENGEITITSDKSWIVTDQWEEGWNQADSSAEAKTVLADVLKCKNFNQGLPSGLWLPAWERGKPPLKPWGDLPLFDRTVEYPVNLYYTVQIPAGTVTVYEPETGGDTACTLDGCPVRWTDGKLELKAEGRIRQLTLRIVAESGRDGLNMPVRVKVVPFAAPLMDWGWHGLRWFSGRCMYSNTFEMGDVEGRYEIDLGEVHDYAEVWVNGRLAGVRVWAPYRLDISGYVVPGINEITVTVANSAANERRHMLVDEGMALGWNRYWNEDNIDRESGNLTAGLLGPVSVLRF